VQATRGDGYAMIYTPLGQAVTIDVSKLGAKSVKALWWDPRVGTASAAGAFDGSGKREFVPPGEHGRGHDWVLVLDDSARGFTEPGR
jgi:hypothetical protein